MKAMTLRRLPAACCVLIGAFAMAAGDDDDKAPAAAQPSAQPSLNGEQQRAVGISVAHPLAAQAPERVDALGVILDATALISDVEDAAAADAVEHSAAAELARLHALHEGGAGASVKMIEAAQAEQTKAQSQSRVAAARFALRWGPLAALPGGARQKIIEAAASGRSLLLRADLPGRHTLGAYQDRALLDVDGIQVPGHVLGALRQASELQGAALLIEVPSAPSGLGPGARIPVVLLTAVRSGMLLPRDALLYDENGAYVYKQLAKKTAAENTRYSPVKVRLLLALGDGWLVDGVDDDDNIVVHGAGVLWSLQGVGAQPQDDDD